MSVSDDLTVPDPQRCAYCGGHPDMITMDESSTMVISGVPLKGSICRRCYQAGAHKP